MAYSEARKRATLKYVKENYYTYAVKFPKELQPILKKAGKDSLNRFVVETMCEKLESMGYELPESCKKN